MGNNEYVELTFDEVIHETSLAWLLAFAEREVWVPKSVSDDPDQSLDGTKQIFLKQWFVDQEGLEDYTSE